MSKNYKIGEKEYQFNNEGFRQALNKRYPNDGSANSRCWKLHIYLNNNFQDYDVQSHYTIKGWLNKDKQGRYPGPQQYETVQLLAEALKVPIENLLFEIPTNNNAKMNIDRNEGIKGMDAFGILLRVVNSYVDSCGYYYSGEDNETEAGSYWLDEIEQAKKLIQANPDSRKIDDRLMLCQELQDFVQSYAYADGLSDRFYQVNPKLKFFASPYAIIEDSMETFVKANVGFRFIPSYQEIVDRYNYFSAFKIIEANEEEYFIKELREAVRKMYYD